MTTASFKFLSSEDFGLLEQREKVEYLEHALEALRASRRSIVLSSLDATKEAGSIGPRVSDRSDTPRR